MKIYKCNTCGNIAVMIEDKGATPNCCGNEMTLLKTQTVTDELEGETSEKHVPIVKQHNSSVTVSIGSKPHPMSDDHYIRWVLLQTNKGFHVAYLVSRTDPVVHFELSEGETITATYAYCNIHGLWIKDIVDSMSKYIEETYCYGCMI